MKIKKIPFIDNSILRKLNNLYHNIKIYSRRSTISQEFLNYNVLIYNGHHFIKRKITKEMIGYKFGEFAFTRKPTKHKEKNKKLRK